MIVNVLNVNTLIVRTLTLHALKLQALIVNAFTVNTLKFRTLIFKAWTMWVLMVDALIVRRWIVEVLTFNTSWHGYCMVKRCSSFRVLWPGKGTTTLVTPQKSYFSRRRFYLTSPARRAMVCVKGGSHLPSIGQDRLGLPGITRRGNMKVREYLRQPGMRWVNYCPWKENEACLLTAIAACYDSNSEVIVKRVQAAIDLHGRIRIADWNDAPMRTFAEVLALVDKLDI